MVHGLRPPALDELGLVEAVRDLVNQTGGEGLDGRVLEIQVSDPEDGLPRLPPAVEANAYHITLEALANVARHAQAVHCSVNFRYEPEESQQPALIIQISDDGTGLPANFRAGVGLRSMRERAEEIGGRLIIEPGQDRGTRVTAWLPVSIS
jgi:two-component system NarL family sensor kinase